MISQEEFFHHLPQVIWHLDDPMADAAAVPLWFVAREASKHVKVVLSGEGSDELFGGYAIYHQPGVVRAGERLPDWGRAPIKKAAAMIPSGVKGKGFLERTSIPLRHRYIGNARVFTDGRGREIARSGPATRPWDVTDPVYDQAEHAGLDDVSTMQLVDINTWLAGDILVKADRMTMAHSLELRVPFLDSEVLTVAVAAGPRGEDRRPAPPSWRCATAMSEVLPKAAAERAKLGFPVPIGHWLTGDSYGFAEQLLREAQTDEWINREEALRACSKGTGGRTRGGVASRVGADRVLAVAPDLRRARLRPGRPRLGAHRRGAALAPGAAITQDPPPRTGCRGQRGVAQGHPVKPGRVLLGA